MQSQETYLSVSRAEVTEEVNSTPRHLVCIDSYDLYALLDYRLPTTYISALCHIVAVDSARAAVVEERRPELDAGFWRYAQLAADRRIILE